MKTLKALKPSRHSDTLMSDEAGSIPEFQPLPDIHLLGAGMCATIRIFKISMINITVESHVYVICGLNLWTGCSKVAKVVCNMARTPKMELLSNLDNRSILSFI